VKDTRRHPDVEMADGLAKDNPQFAIMPVGRELVAIIAVTILVVGAVAARLILFG